MTAQRHALPLLETRRVKRAGETPADLSGLRILLVNPPQTYPEAIEREYQSYLPLGLAMIAAVLERAGASVKCVDCLAFDTVTRNEATRTVTFGLDDALLRDAIRAHSPHVVGITNPFTHFIDDAVRAAQLVKDVDAAIQVVMGGIEASLPERNTRLLARTQAIDVLVQGEGEVTVVELLSRYDPSTGAFRRLEDVAGIVYRDEGGRPVATSHRGFLKEMDTLPLPAYHLFDVDRMFANRFYARWRGRRPGVRCLPIHTSRGCPYSCNFCSVHSQVGKGHRRHSAAYVRRHLELVMSRYGVRHVHFEDDNLTLHHEHSLELFRAIEPLGITWDTPNGTRADSITPELVSAMRGAGAVTITVAVESGSQTVLTDIVNKRLSLASVVEGVGHLRDGNIPTIVFFIIGFPGETEADVRATLRFARKLALEYGTVNFLFVATPLPGTPLERQCRAEGLYAREPDNESLLAAIRLNQSALIQTPNFTKTDLYAWAREEIDVPSLRTMGQHIPMFFAATDRGLKSAGAVVGSELSARRLSERNFWSVPTRFAPSAG
jgi:radical SAM superfamily enzyme YgiQ (UPF0313 family)